MGAVSMRQSAQHVYDKKPGWLKIKPPSSRFNQVNSVLEHSGIFTVCQEAHCPNMSECWSSGTATFIILGDTCTRACRFCAVKSGNPKGKLDDSEPKMLAKSVSRMNKLTGLKYAVITSVDRDDLPDLGAAHFAACVSEVKKSVPGILVEVLAPDFQGRLDCIKKVVSSGIAVFGHNIETVERLQQKVRDKRASYSQSLSVLAAAKKMNPKVYTKSSIMLGLGETEDEAVHAMKDLRKSGVQLLTLGQYLRPSSAHLPVYEYITPEKFNKLKLIGEGLGFLHVASGPFVRSSYKAGEFFIKEAKK
jgi:lipoyl synthase